MSVYALTGNDTIQVADRVLKNFGDGNVAALTFPNDLVQVKTGKNGNSVFNTIASGQQSDLELRIIRGSADDRFLQSLLTQQRRDLPSFPLMGGYIVKRIGDGNANVTNDTIFLKGGVFSKIPEAAENTEGDTNTALTVYRLRFSDTARAAM